MDLIISGLRIPVEKDDPAEYIGAASLKLGISTGSITLIRILYKELDLSDQENLAYIVSIAARVPGNTAYKNNFPPYKETERQPVPQSAGRERPIIVGFGPAGMFAALELVSRGLKPLIFERGKKIEERSEDVRRFIAGRKLDPESNIQFGEGGAGSFSDGKLFSKAANSEHADRVLETFIRFGAPEEIRFIHKPHLGTDMLCAIIARMRDFIIARGGEIHYGSKMTDMILSGGILSGVIINAEREYRSSPVYLAIGHSARDTFSLLYEKGVALEQRQISVGVRIEHPAAIINRMRYGEKYMNFPGLGAAAYSMTHTNKNTGRGVYTFCMCPGGEVINASSSPSLLALNGMSYSARAGEFSNSALVVPCRSGDYGSADPLAGIKFQEEIERKAFRRGDNWAAPAQNLIDFMEGRISRQLNENSYKMGTTPAEMNELFPDFVSTELLNAFNNWKKDHPLFVSEHALLLGAETRASCPVRIKRNEKNESVSVRNLYPIGEGSGYAGGITSSAVDAIKTVEKSL